MNKIDGMQSKVWFYFKNIMFITIPTLVLMLILLEFFFRTVIPASFPPQGWFYEKDKIISYNNIIETGLFTIGKYAEIQSRWRINNMGWNNLNDYYPGSDRKLIAVIGDSYIEAFQVDVDKNYPFLLGEKLKDFYRVYSFGASGYSLSQYLHVSRYVKKYLDPDIIVFNLVHNDFDESIHEFHSDKPCFMQIAHNANDDSFIEILPETYVPYGQTYKCVRFLNKSALYRYLRHNLKVLPLMRAIIYGTNKYEANIDIRNVKERENLILKGTEHLIGKIMLENENRRIIFLLDAPREAIYNNSLDKSNVLWMHTMMKHIAEKYSIEYIDLTEPMQRDYEKNKIKFNSEIDGHWNEYGHSFVANLLCDYLEK